MYMKNVETLDTTMGHHCAAASIMTKKKEPLGKCVQMYRAPFLYLPGAPNSLNPLLYIYIYIFFIFIFFFLFIYLYIYIYIYI